MVELEYIIKHRISDKKWISSASSENASVKSSTTNIQFSPESRTLTPNPVIISQASYRTSPSTIDSRILQSSVCGTQSQWKLQTNNRFITPEPVSKDSFIFHGVSFHNPESFRRLPLGSDPGPFRRLLSCTDSSQSSAFTPLFSESPSVPIQSSSLWPGFSPIRLHMDSKTFSGTPSETGHPNTCLFGRLDNTPLGQKYSPPTFTHDIEPSQPTWIQSQLGKIKANPIPRFNLPRCTLQVRSTISHAIRSSFTTNQNLGFTFATPGQFTSSQVGTISGSTEFCGTLYSPWSPGNSTYTSTSSSQLGFRLEPCRYTNSTSTITYSGPPTVDRPSVCGSRHTSLTSTSTRYFVHRCKSGGLGSSLSPTSSLRPLVSRGVHPSYQYSRNEGCVASHHPVTKCLQRTCYCHSNRQYHSVRLSEESGGNQMPRNSSMDISSVSLMPVTEHFLYSQTCSRPQKCFGRPAFSERSSYPDRVDITPRCLSLAMEEVVSSTSGCFCHSMDTQASTLLFPTPRSTGSGSGCIITTMDNTYSVPLSTYPIVTSCIEETSATSPASHPCSSMESDKHMVPTPTKTNSGTGHRCTKTTYSAQSTRTATKQFGTSKSTSAQSTRCLAAISGLKQQGFSQSALSVIIEDTVLSTRTVYDAKWIVFTSWCKNQIPVILPHKINVPQLADFLCYLFNTKHLSLTTLQGYRSAISSVLKCYNREHITQDPIISRLIQGFRRILPRKPRFILPKWNLALVLKCLSQPPFHPLENCSIQHLTWKTAFLVLLGTACRRSELHAMDFKSIEHSPDWSWIKLSLLPDFLAKHQASHHTVHIPRTFHLQCLNSEDPEELTLCPVRALRQYLKITKNHRSNRRSIFLPISTKSTKSLSANTVSWWIKYLIRFAYSSASPDTLKELQIPEGEPSLFRATHEIRALSSTLSWMRHTSSI